MDKKPLTNNLYHIKNLVMIYKIKKCIWTSFNDFIERMMKLIIKLCSLNIVFFGIISSNQFMNALSSL